MPRSGEQARRRLERAALEAFGEHGFERTTAAEIARRAGVTERTFFHHFADKREVLFGGEEVLRGLLLDAVRAAPSHLGALAVLEHAFAASVGWVEDGRDYAEPRHALLVATPALREREAAKLASLAASLADALAERGVAARRARVAARAAVAAFEVAVEASYDEGADGLAALLAGAFDDLRAVCGAGG